MPEHLKSSWFVHPCSRLIPSPLSDAVYKVRGVESFSGIFSFLDYTKYFVCYTSCICKKILHLQENLAFARKSCICKKILLLQDFLAHWDCNSVEQENVTFARKILPSQENHVKARNLCICNEILQKQEYLSTKCKGVSASPKDIQFF